MFDEYGNPWPPIYEFILANIPTPEAPPFPAPEPPYPDPPPDPPPPIVTP